LGPAASGLQGVRILRVAMRPTRKHSVPIAYPYEV